MTDGEDVERRPEAPESDGFDVEEQSRVAKSLLDKHKAPSVRDFGGGSKATASGSAVDKIHPDLLRLFVASVIALNIALLAISLGVMVWYFEGMTRWGQGLILVGLFAGFRTYQYYREYDGRDWNEET